ncbi:MAG: protein phosphatase CheZ [Proteobacteria bacterium]|nr:protein phosphatase CheZ [Pseudomonadota bacterium]
MNETRPNKISISRSDFLDSFTQLYHAIKDYDELIGLVSRDQAFSLEKVKDIIQDRMTKLEFGSVNVKAMEIIGAYIRFTLEKFKGDTLSFLIPDSPDDDFFSINDGFLELSEKIETIEHELKEIEEKVFYISRLLPPHNIEKIRLLLKAISSFFKSIVRKDIEDMKSHVNHMHHLTASKESYFVINDIGRVIRDIHNSLNDFSAQVPVEALDSSIMDDMPDAIDKLNLVIQRMEKSANSTLDDVENLLDGNSKQKEENDALIGQCAALEKRLVAIKDTHQVAGEEIDGIIENLKTGLVEKLNQRSEQLKEEESTYFNIISNQSFQDITGQTLKKIISFIEQLEFSLLQILQKYSGKPMESERKEEVTSEKAPVVSPLVGIETEEGLVLEGPQDNKAKAEVAKQADVDKMLAEFGF